MYLTFLKDALFKPILFCLKMYMCISSVCQLVYPYHVGSDGSSFPGLKPEVIDRIKKQKDVTFEFSRDGDTFTAVNMRGQDTETHTYRLGEPFKSKNHEIEVEVRI